MLLTFHICSLLYTASIPFPVSAPWLIFELCFHLNVLLLITAKYSFHSCQKFTIIIVKVFKSFLVDCLPAGKTPKNIAEEEDEKSRARRKDVKDTIKANTSIMVWYYENIDSKLKGSVGSNVSAQRERERLLHENINC